ncbi:hypothetical protein [Aureimonas leprariae]|uniref:hypothetical protein n=1 Tax=Plantimonas leprariae TaxID=2615207 RepID=UPI001FE58E50|nr:hypothetical protein [Aureimonas leprariae]
MQDQIYVDGISEITVTGSIVRIDLTNLSATERDENDSPKTVFRQRIVMSVEAFANAAELVQKALAGLVQAGAIRRLDDVKARPVRIESVGNGETAKPAPGPNVSPNFN